MRSASFVVASLVAIGFSVQAVSVAGQTAAQSMGSVRLAQAARANGQPLSAGTYTVRLTTETGASVVGQPAASTRWVEFVQGGQVRGRELASVISSADIAAVGETKPLPAPGTARVHLLRGGEYLRVWINSGGTHYLVHLATGAGAKS
jgi:hypothetical protein